MQKFIKILPLIWCSFLSAEEFLSIFKTLVAKNVDYYNYLEQGVLEVNAKSSFFSVENNEMTFDNPILIFIDHKTKKNTKITANKAIQNFSKDSIILKGNVIVIDENKEIYGEYFQIFFEDNSLSSNDNHVKIKYTTLDDTIYADGDDLRGKLSEIEGRITLSRNVKIISKNGILTANKTTFFIKNKKVEKILATGNPAKFDGAIEENGTNSTTKNTKPILIKANAIDYLVKKNLLVLNDNVSIKQNNSADIKSDKLIYNVKTKEIITKNKENKRTDIYLENVEEFKK